MPPNLRKCNFYEFIKSSCIIRLVFLSVIVGMLSVGILLKDSKSVLTSFTNRSNSFIGSKLFNPSITSRISSFTFTKRYSSTDEKIYLRDKFGSKKSFWHDISLKNDGNLFNMVVEIPKFSKSKMEISKTNEFNPIMQDIKDGLPRFYPGPIYWNYGALPQTWEDPAVKGNQEVFNSYGDNDPLDVVEIGDMVFSTGSIIQINILGALSMIDQGELDWKIIAIQKSDPNFDSIQNIKDIEEYYPGTISGIREWFRWYKTPEGKNKSTYGHNEQALDRIDALNIVSKCHDSYLALKNFKVQNKNKFWLGS